MFLSFSSFLLVIFFRLKISNTVWSFDRIVQEDFEFYCVLLTIENQKHKLRDNGGDLSIIAFFLRTKSLFRVHPVLSIT